MTKTKIDKLQLGKAQIVRFTPSRRSKIEDNKDSAEKRNDKVE